LGLAASPERDAVSLLADAYRFEPDIQVRRAIVRALSQRNEARRRATLALARDLDPDPGVRALARSALGGRRLAVAMPPAGRQVAWVMVRANSEAERKSVASRPGALVRPDGLALPVVADPDGGLLVPGLEDAGKLSLRLGALALERPSRQPSRNVRAKRR
ncbi:MAG TPA: hypothetical protein VFB62_14325, partial [Polyangiaceae bacterium]|nr:hypothetical protein [Polyangiaceae bacterium]